MALGNKRIIEGILWDNDGVLVDTEKFFFQATYETLKTVGITLTKERFVAFSLISGKGMAAYLAGTGLDAQACETLRVSRNNRYSTLLQNQPVLIDGVAQTLEALSKTYKMGIVTSSRRDHFELMHRETGILHYFSFVLTNEDYAKTKPAPDPYLKGLEQLGLGAEACVAVEDSARGLVSANKAGMVCFMIPNALSRPETYQGDYVLLDTVRQLPEHLHKMA